MTLVYRMGEKTVLEIRLKKGNVTVQLSVMVRLSLDYMCRGSSDLISGCGAQIGARTLLTGVPSYHMDLT